MGKEYYPRSLTTNSLNPTKGVINGFIHGWGSKKECKECLIEKGQQWTILGFHNV
jgi:hypothetical protein